MADKKISALTSASTPLAGTEVLPIVQSGATVKVSAENLVKTAQPNSNAKTIPYLNASKTPTNGAELQFDGANLGLGSTPTVPSQGISFEMSGGQCIYSRDQSGVPQLYISSNAVGTGYSAVYKQNGYAAQYVLQGFDGSHAFATAPSGAAGNSISFTNRFVVSNAGDVTLSTGNLIQGTAAKGINFTANTPAAGMTSQLLNWYEEGTWTPTDASGAGLTLASVSGTYVKVGKLVTCYFSVTYPSTANTNTATIGGLPFTTGAGVPNPGGAFVLYCDSAVSPINGAVATSGTSFELYTTAGAAVTNANLSGKILRMCVSYFSAT